MYEFEYATELSVSHGRVAYKYCIRKIDGNYDFEYYTKSWAGNGDREMLDKWKYSGMLL